MRDPCRSGSGSNADPVLRRGSILINDQQMDVNQEAAPCSFVVGGTPETIPALGAQFTIPVTTHSACQWTAISESPFATVTPPSGIRIRERSDHGPLELG